MVQGRDNAGAVIELLGEDGVPTRARVTDVVLGTAEADVRMLSDREIEFTVTFPGGATITYRGREVQSEVSDGMMFSGMWRQHPGGIFAADVGSWTVPDEG